MLLSLLLALFVQAPVAPDPPPAGETCPSGPGDPMCYEYNQACVDEKKDAFDDAAEFADSIRTVCLEGCHSSGWGDLCRLLCDLDYSSDLSAIEAAYLAQDWTDCCQIKECPNHLARPESPGGHWLRHDPGDSVFRSTL